ncbi:hypothetical protein B0J18DRAFT_65180 [Chaetomium sp. MPI-SDFR-AT-0129]|nr:hypothetical protein B0J18DRAFT_65180 [Chaetomium sp. MPI-SDFR-AT-0129]
MCCRRGHTYTPCADHRLLFSAQFLGPWGSSLDGRRPGSSSSLPIHALALLPCCFVSPVILLPLYPPIVSLLLQYHHPHKPRPVLLVPTYPHAHSPTCPLVRSFHRMSACIVPLFNNGVGHLHKPLPPAPKLGLLTYPPPFSRTSNFQPITSPLKIIAY